MSITFYIAARLQETARGLRDHIVFHGHKVQARWLEATDYGMRGKADELRREAAYNCLNEIDQCSDLVLIAEPAGEMTPGGKHVEFGYALARGKKLHVIGRRENVFTYLTDVKFYTTYGEFLASLPCHLTEPL